MGCEGGRIRMKEYNIMLEFEPNVWGISTINSDALLHCVILPPAKITPFAFVGKYISVIIVPVYVAVSVLFVLPAFGVIKQDEIFAGALVCRVGAVATLAACHALFLVVIAIGVVVPAGRFVNFAVKGAVV
jgi:hypothetical protein